MKKIDLGQILTILANIGVVAGIVILTIEIRDSNRQARSQFRPTIPADSMSGIQRREVIQSPPISIDVA